MIIDTFSLVTLCAALVLVTAWGLVGWELKRRIGKEALEWVDYASTMGRMRAAAVSDRKWLGGRLDAARKEATDHRANANLWREAALDTEARSRKQYALPEWPIAYASDKQYTRLVIGKGA